METIDEWVEDSGYSIPADEFVAKLTKIVATSSYKLLGLWKEIGISGEQLRDRQSRLIQHQTSLARDMIEEEQGTVFRIEEKIRQLKEELTILSLNLKLEDPGLISINGDNHVTLLDKEAELKNVVEHLLAIKEQRMEDFNKLCKEEQDLCAKLFLPPKFASTMFAGDKIPSDEEVQTLRDHIDFLQREKQSRYQQLSLLQNNITVMIKELEVPVKELTKFEKQIMSHLDEIVLSEENILSASNLLKRLEEKQLDYQDQIKLIKKRLFTLWDLLEIDDADRELILSQHTSTSLKTVKALTKIMKDLEEQRLANMGTVFKKALSRLEELWDKCLTSEKDRINFKDLLDDNYTEENLELLEEEIKTLQEFFEENEAIFVLIHKRLNLWSQMIEFEKQCQDVTRYQNRGGNLLKEEKKRKAFHKNIPKLEKEIHDLIKLWEEDCNDVFKINGIPVEMFFNNQWEDYRAEKELLKTQRHQRNNTPGTSYMVTTPSKRSFVPNLATVQTPKRAKLGMAHHTPSTSSRFLQTPTRVAISRIPKVTPATPVQGSGVKIPRRMSSRIQNRNKSQLGAMSMLGGKTPLKETNLRVPGQLEEYSVNYESFKGKITNQMRSTVNGTPSQSISSASHASSKHSLKVVGTKYAKRCSNEAQRRRSMNRSHNNSRRHDSRYQLRVFTEQGNDSKI